MIERHMHNKICWVDVVSPTVEEIREIVKECKIPLEYTADLTTMTPRSEVFVKKNFLKVTLDFPIVKRTDINHPHEVKFIATKKHLITIRFEDIEALHRFSKEFEVSSILTHAGKNASAGHLCMSLLERMYRSMTVKLDYLESKLADVEEEIFNQREKEMVFEISRLNRRLIAFRQTLYAHEAVLENMQEQVVIAFGKPYAQYVDILQKEYEHQIGRVNAITSTLDELRETNNALLTTKQNEVMKILTIMAFITFPLTLFTSMFGMNTKTTPIVGRDGDFWIILSVMAIVSVSFFAFFKYKRWM